MHVDSKGLLMGYEKERECIKPRAGDADLWIIMLKELHGLTERHLGGSGTWKGARTKKRKMSQFERFVT